ncbi:MAG: ribonuclease J [Candidatus Roizmanbacteria bacterium]
MDNRYKLRFIPLGGVIGVTKNMYVYELYKDDLLQDIVIIDCGIGFPRNNEFGVDFIIPDITYLKDKLNKIRAVVVSHGHEDHTSALPYHYEALGKPPVFTSKLTSMFLQNKFEEAKIPLDITEIKYGQQYVFGEIKVEFITMTHSIPDTTHLVLRTPAGTIYHGSDYKLDLTPPYGSSPDFYSITKAGHEGVMCMMSDCLGSEREGLTLSESIVGQTFEDEMRKTKGKFIMTTFSSNISRIRQCVEAAIKFNRKIIFLGRSMKGNTEAATEIGYLPIPFSLIGKEEEVMSLPPNKVCIIAAGSQGQYGSALAKLAYKQNKVIKLKAGDKLVVSSDPIPGNESEIYALIEEMALQGVDVVYTDIQEQLHASGHGNQEDIKFLMRFVHPKYMIPIGGDYRHQRQYQKLAGDLGQNKDTVFLLDEGDTVWFINNQASRGEKIETKNVYVDAFGVGDVGNVVLKDRKLLSTEGMVIASLVFNPSGTLASKPHLITRGFVYDKDEEKLFQDAIRLIEKLLPSQVPAEESKVKKDVGRTLENYFREMTGRSPLVMVDTVMLKN